MTRGGSAEEVARDLGALTSWRENRENAPHTRVTEAE